MRVNDYSQSVLRLQSGNLIGSAERCFSPMQSEAAHWVIELIPICALKEQLKFKLGLQPVKFDVFYFIQRVALN